MELKPLTAPQLLGIAILVGYALIEHYDHPMLAAALGYCAGSLWTWCIRALRAAGNEGD
jgi:hypothetical protein